MKKQFILILLLTVLLAGCGSKIEANMDSKIDSFSFTTQDENTLKSEDLDGDYWIAYFFYTNCTMVCPRTTANIVNVQDQLIDDGIEPTIVGFSIDPDYDTPDVLTDYSAENGINNDYFTLLTGYDFDTIRTLSKESFKTVLEGGGPDDHAFIHSTYFFLVDPDGKIIKRYDALSQDENGLLVEDASKVM